MTLNPKQPLSHLCRDGGEWTAAGRLGQCLSQYRFGYPQQFRGLGFKAEPSTVNPNFKPKSNELTWRFGN